MARIYCPDEKFTGTAAGVEFIGGVGETEDEFVIAFLMDKGYIARTSVVRPDIEKSKTNELIEYAKAIGVDLHGISQRADLVKAIEEAEKFGRDC